MTGYLCPAPKLSAHGDGVKLRVCAAPLPCVEHEIPDAYIGMLLHGNAYLAVAPVAPAAPRRRRRLLLVALTVLSAVLVVSCMGDAAFTGKALLTLAVVVATTAVLLLDLARPNRNGATS